MGRERSKSALNCHRQPYHSPPMISNSSNIWTVRVQRTEAARARSLDTSYFRRIHIHGRGTVDRRGIALSCFDMCHDLLERFFAMEISKGLRFTSFGKTVSGRHKRLMVTLDY